MKPLLIAVAVMGVLAGLSAPVISRYAPKPLVYVFSATAITIAFVLVYRIERGRRTRIREKVSRLFEGRQAISAEDFGTNHFTGQQSQIATALLNRLRPYFPFDLSRVAPDDRLHEDLELRYWDDLADVDIVRWLEKTYRISFTNDEARGIETIRQLVEATCRKIAVQPGVVADLSRLQTGYRSKC